MEQERAYKEEHIKQLNEQIRLNFPLIHPIDASMTIAHEGISKMVMLDRYAQKDRTLKTLAAGDLVVVKIKYDPRFPTLGTGFVQKILKNDVVLKIDKEYWGQIDPSYQHQDGVITIGKDSISKPLEIFYEQIAKRVGYYLAGGENDQYAKRFYDEVGSLNIIPAGRVLYGSGSGTSVTYFNCFVMPMPEDSREGISNHRKEVMEIMSRGGGVGTNGSTLRPKNAVAVAVGGTSSGAVSWLNDLSSLTDLVQQGGSRRGAQMIMLQDWHPDILEFIISKMQKPEILKYIADNFKNKHIQQLAKDKLQFRPYSTFTKSALKETINHSKDADIIKEAKKRLKLGGEHMVIAPDFLSGANISVGITKDFMAAVKAKETYQLRFPDVANFTKEQKAIYDSEWQKLGDVRVWAQKGLPVKVYETVSAKELWDLINFCATYSAEPGVFFIDRANETTNATAYDQKVVCTNPCGEQPLTPYSVCNLAAINLNNMIDHKTSEIWWDKLRNTIQTSIRLQDNIIDKTPYFLDENEFQAKGERRLGMGVMGLHDFLIWKGETYGSPSSIILINKLFEFIAVTAYKASADLGQEKGFFPFMKDLDRLMNTGFIKGLPQETRAYIREKGGLRNSHLLTIAPTGSTGTMIGVSTGLEPYFAFKYFRSGRLGKFIEIDQNIVSEWKENHNYTNDVLPNLFVSSMSLSPEAHADVQTTIQRWIDSSISKTVNAPKGYSVKQVEKIYMRLYDNGAKGGTVYVDGSRDAQVLSLSNDSKEKKVRDKDIILDDISKERIDEINKSLEDIPGNKSNKNLGTNIGDICPICKEGSVEDIGGCHSCTHCGAQLKCGI